MSKDKFVEAFQYLVAYQLRLESDIAESKEMLKYFDNPFKDMEEARIKEREKELEALKNLIKNWREND